MAKQIKNRHSQSKRSHTYTENGMLDEVHKVYENVRAAKLRLLSHVNDWRPYKRSIRCVCVCVCVHHSNVQSWGGRSLVLHENVYRSNMLKGKLNWKHTIAFHITFTRFSQYTEYSSWKIGWLGWESVRVFVCVCMRETKMNTYVLRAHRTKMPEAFPSNAKQKYIQHQYLSANHFPMALSL